MASFTISSRSFVVTSMLMGIPLNRRRMSFMRVSKSTTSSFDMMRGFVVTPSRMPQLRSSFNSSRFAVSANIFILLHPPVFAYHLLETEDYQMLQHDMERLDMGGRFEG